MVCFLTTSKERIHLEQETRKWCNQQSASAILRIQEDYKNPFCFHYRDDLLTTHLWKWMVVLDSFTTISTYFLYVNKFFFNLEKGHIL